MTGLASLIYLGLATRALGVTGFGVLVLIQTYIQIIIDLTTFQSSQAVIRYGAICLEHDDKVAFQQLIKFTILLDVLGVLAGFAIAFIIAPILGSYMGWEQALIAQMQTCSVLILFTIVATPKGVLQLCHRFDLLAWQITVSSLMRLVGTIAVVLMQGSLGKYLLVWCISEIVGGLFLIWNGWQVGQKQGLLQGMDLSLINLTKHHPGLWKFCIVSNFNSSLPIVIRHFSSLVVGLLATPAAVGLFQASYELSTPLKDLAQLWTQSLYPELAHLSSQAKWQPFRTLLLKSSAIAMTIGLLILTLSIGVGQSILKYAFGDAFVSAYGILVLLVAAEVFAIGGCALEPALFAMGHPAQALQVNAIAVLAVYLPLLLILTQTLGVMGAGIAALVSTALTLLLGILLTWHQLRCRLHS